MWRTRAALDENPFLSCLLGNKASISIHELKDHPKGAATKIRKDHQQRAVVAMTSEYRSSQTCGGCFGPVVRQRATIFNNRKKQTKSVNDASQCFNTKCPLCQSGFAVQDRDTVAALCIALNGIRKAMDNKSLLPFTRNSAAIKMLNRNSTPEFVGL